MRSRNVGICHSDFELYEGRYIIPVSYPIIPGHEWCGEVVEAGRRSAALSLGDRVVGECVVGPATTISASRSTVPTRSTSWPAANGCTSCRRALVHRRGDGRALLGRLQRDRRRRRDRPGDEVAVIGGGPIGLLCAMAAATMGGSVTLIEPQQDRRALGLDVGARRRSIRARLALGTGGRVDGRPRVRRRDRSGRFSRRDGERTSDRGIGARVVSSASTSAATRRWRSD